MRAALLNHKIGIGAVRPPFTLFLVIMFLMAIVAPVVFLLLAPQRAASVLVILPVNFTLAWFTAGTARVVVSQPFSFTLPQQLAAIRQQLLIIATAGNAVVGLLLLSTADSAVRLPMAAAIFFGGVAVYVALCTLIFRVIRVEWVIVLGTFGTIMMAGRYAPAVAFAEFIIRYPALVMLATALLLVPFWQLFSGRGVYRRLTGRADIEVPYNADYTSSREKAAAVLIQQRRLQSRGEARWFVALHNLVARHDSVLGFCFRHQCLLALRRRLLTVASFQLIPTLVFLVAIVFLAQTPVFPPYNLTLMYVFSFLLFWGLQPIAAQSPFLPYRRSDLAAATVLMGLVANLLCIAVGLVMLPIYWLADLVSQRDLAELLWTQPEPGATPFDLITYFSLFVPVALTLKLFRPFWQDGIGAAVTFVFVISVAILADAFFDDYIHAGPFALIALHLSGWLIYAPVAFWYFRTHDLN